MRMYSVVTHPQNLDDSSRCSRRGTRRSFRESSRPRCKRSDKALLPWLAGRDAMPRIDAQAFAGFEVSDARVTNSLSFGRTNRSSLPPPLIRIVLSHVIPSLLVATNFLPPRSLQHEGAWVCFLPLPAQHPCPAQGTFRFIRATAKSPTFDIIPLIRLSVGSTFASRAASLRRSWIAIVREVLLCSLSIILAG